MNYSTDNIHKICEVYGITDYTINGDGTIDVDGHVRLFDKGLTKLPLKFNLVSGDFYCNHNGLTTLEGSPKSVGGIFNCGWNKLTSLKFAPISIGGDFDCGDNNLKSLEWCPKSVGDIFFCVNNQLTTLEYGPQTLGGEFWFYGNPIHDKLGDIDYKSYFKQINRDKILNELLKNNNNID